MTVRYGLLGYGRWGAQHAAAIRQAPDAELVAVAVSSPETAQRARSEQGVEAYTEYAELLERSDVDAVDIVLPNHLHHRAALQSLRAGKHVLLEKPMALTSEQCQEILDAATSTGRKLNIGHELRFSSLWAAPRKLIDDGRLGILKSAKIHLSRHPFRPGASGWRADATRVGSWLLEEPVHFYDLVTWYFQGAEEPAKLYALGNSRTAELEQQELYENMSTSIGFSRGGFAIVSQSLAAYEHHLRAEFIGSNGVLKAWWSGATDRDDKPTYGLEFFTGEQKIDLPVEGVPGELQELNAQVAHFTQAILTDGRPMVTGADGIWPVKLSEAAQRSILEDRVIQFEPGC